MYKKIISIALAVIFTISTFGSISEATVTEGYWRLDKFEENIYDKPFVEETDNPNINRLIDFRKPQGNELDSDFKLGQTALLMNISESMNEGNEVEEIYKAYIKFSSPPVVLHPDNTFTMSYGGKVIKDTTDLMREVMIINYHQLFYPGRVPQPAAVYIERDAELTLISHEIENEGLNPSKFTEITPLAPTSDEDTYLLRVRIVSGAADRSFAYVYRWVKGPFPGTEDIKVFIDNQLLISDVPPLIINSRTMVPARVILEKLGAEILWDDLTRTVTATKENTTVRMTIGDPNVYVNDVLTTIDSAPIIVNDRTLVPARFLAEIFNALVEWNETDRTVKIIL